jgi:hypothetical protein
MRRRDVLAGMGFAGYSLVVLVDERSAASRERTDERLRRGLDRLAPPGAAAGLAPAEPNMRLVELETDVLVAGGGLAGVCAALAAARNGARVLLVQDRSRLGGNSSSEVKMHVVGASCHKGRPGWREGGLVEELRLDDAVNNPQRCWELWDLLLYDKVVSEPNVTLLLETAVYSAATRDGRIESVMARCDRSEHVYRVRAKVYVDATGDSRLGLEAAAEMRTGREARGEFGESLAPEEADRETLGSSILFTSRRHPTPMPYTPPSWARRITREQLRFRDVSPGNWEYGYWWIEWGGERDTVHDNERIRFELLSIVTGVWNHIKNSGEHPESANWALEWVGMMPGRRGSRRLVGDVVVTQGDLVRGTWPDAVAMGGWPMDDHPPGGFDRPDLPPNTVLRTDEPYDLPLRALYSRNVANLMMAGRNISATHAAFTSTRVMATCAAVGQAVGTAAAMCVERGIAPRELSASSELVARLQQRLLRQDQSIRGVAARDPEDLARTARVRASAEAGEARAALVVDGVDRDIPGNPATRRPAETHHWAAPLGPDGAWLELSWPEPQAIGEVVLKFDTGFPRELTLTASDSINRGIVRAPQPETVRDYSIVATLPDGRERTLATIEGNHQRLNRVRVEPATARAVRVVVTRTNGLPEARVFEVRCYAPGS